MAVDPLIEPSNGDWKKAYGATRTRRFGRRPVDSCPLPGIP